MAGGVSDTSLPEMVKLGVWVQRGGGVVVESGLVYGAL